MIPNITQGSRMGGLLVYLAGPGRANEHAEPHLVAGDGAVLAWYEDTELNRDAALDMANMLDRAHQFYGTDVQGGHVFHCSLSLSAEEGVLSDQAWGRIAADYMEAMGFTGADGHAPCRWAAVRHGLSRNGNDHIHVVASMVREDGTKWNAWKSKYRAQQVCRSLEAKHGLVRVGEMYAERGVSPAEQARARRAGAPEVQRHFLARTVRACAGASVEEAEFVRRARQQGLLVRPRFAAGRTDVVTGYSVAQRPGQGERPVWFGGNTLGRDLALPKLREGWVSSPENAAEAVREWGAAARNRRVVAPGRELLSPGAELWEAYAREVGQLRAFLAAAGPTDPVVWARAAREASAVFGAWSLRLEPVPGPLAAAARELGRAAQLRRYPQPDAMPVPGGPSARGAVMLLLAAGSRSDTAAYALLFRQLAATAKAIHDMHAAAGDLRRVRGLAAAVLAATAVVEASARVQTTEARTAAEPDRGEAEEVRQDHDPARGRDGEAARSQLLADRLRGGAPIPDRLTRADPAMGTAVPHGPPGPRLGQPRRGPDIER